MFQTTNQIYDEWEMFQPRFIGERYLIQLPAEMACVAKITPQSESTATFTLPHPQQTSDETQDSRGYWHPNGGFLK